MRKEQREAGKRLNAQILFALLIAEVFGVTRK